MYAFLLFLQHLSLEWSWGYWKYKLKQETCNKMLNTQPFVNKCKQYVGIKIVFWSHLTGTFKHMPHIKLMFLMIMLK